MKFKDFYAFAVDENIAEKLDEDYKKTINLMIEKINKSSWTKKQKNVQIKKILPNIALYKTFIKYGISKEKAKELVRKRAYSRAEKGHKVLAKLFNIPKFSTVFRNFMKRVMSEKEIWTSEIISNNDERFAMDITKCLWKDTCEYFDCPELCEVFCSCDNIIFKNIKQMEFKREKTLGINKDKCDFCFNFKKKSI